MLTFMTLYLCTRRKIVFGLVFEPKVIEEVVKSCQIFGLSPIPHGIRKSLPLTGGGLRGPPPSYLGNPYS